MRNGVPYCELERSSKVMSGFFYYDAGRTNQTEFILH